MAGENDARHAAPVAALAKSLSWVSAITKPADGRLISR